MCAPESGAELPTIRFRSPDDYIAAVPALLGFYPERSIVLIAHDEATSRTGPTARFDLTLTAAATLAAPCRTGIGEMVRLLKQQGAQRVICIVIDDRDVTAALPAIEDRLVRSLAGEDDDWDADLVDIFVVRRIADGELWTCAHGDTGRLSDPEINEATLARLVDGRAVRRSRDELVARLAEEGPGIDEAECRAAERAAVTGRGGLVAGRDARRLRLVVDAVVAAAGTGDCAVSDGDVAQLGAALLSLRVRDSAFALAATEFADAATDTFAHLVRRLRGTPRAAAATLVAGISYVRSVGPMVGIGLDAALAADPEYRAALLLLQAFDSGMTPECLAELVEVGNDVACELGVRLPGRTQPIPMAG